jgi:hypothetical protein
VKTRPQRHIAHQKYHTNCGETPVMRSERTLKNYRDISDMTLEEESEGRSALSVLRILVYCIGLVFILFVFAQRRGRGAEEG